MAGGRAYTPYGSGTHVLRMGLYDEQLDRYVARFGAESLLVLDYALVTGQPDAARARVCDPLGVARHAFQTTVQYQRSGATSGPGGTRLTRLVRGLGKAAVRAKGWQ